MRSRMGEPCTCCPPRRTLRWSRPASTQQCRTHTAPRRSRPTWLGLVLGLGVGSGLGSGLGSGFGSGLGLVSRPTSARSRCASTALPSEARVKLTSREVCCSSCKGSALPWASHPNSAARAHCPACSTTSSSRWPSPPAPCAPSTWPGRPSRPSPSAPSSPSSPSSPSRGSGCSGCAGGLGGGSTSSCCRLGLGLGLGLTLTLPNP